MIHNKKVSAVLITLLVACYLLATGAAAQTSELKSTNANITYTKETLSYGDVWAFDSETHAKTSYDLNGSKSLAWYTKGGASNTDATKSDPYPSNYFETVTIKEGKLDTENSIPMAQLGFEKFNNGVEVGTVASTAVVAPVIPVVKTSGDAAGIYSVVPGKTGTYYVHAYMEAASVDTVTMSYALLDSCAATNAYAQCNDFSKTVTLNRIGETNWYRGEIKVDTVSWYAASVDCEEGQVTNDDSIDNAGNGTYIGGLSLGGEDIPYYYNKWTNAKAYYDTVLIFQIPVGTALGPISSGGKVIIENGNAEMGTLTAHSIFGESIEVKSEAQMLPNMPIVLSVAAQDENVFMGFTDAAGSEVSPYIEGQDNSNALQTITASVTYVYHHEGDLDSENKVSAQWSIARALPSIAVSGDAKRYNFVDAKVGGATFTKGTQNVYTFTLDFADAVDFKSGTYTVTGDSINGASTHTGEISSEANSFVASCLFDETVVTIAITDNADVQYTFKYTIKPVVTGDKTAKNLTTGNEYVFVEDALMEANSGDTVVLIKNASLTKTDTEGNTSTKWATNNAGYTVRSGVTLLIPFDDANTVIRDNMKDIIVNDDYTVYPEKVEYRSLTMPSGTKLTVASGGAICVGSKAHKQMVGQTGPYGAIYMDSNSNITLQGGANLYAWGYIFPGNNGVGTVTAQSGSCVYEALMAMDYPGSVSLTLHLYGGKGSNALYALSNLEGGRAFPLRSYSVRNVEVPTTFCHGAKCYGFYHLYGTSAGNYGDNCVFIGDENDGAFRLTSSDATLTKSYAGGRNILKIKGDVTISSMKIHVQVTSSQGGDIDTSKVSGLLLPSCYDIQCTSGKVVLNENVIICEGATVYLGAEAVAEVASGKSLYLLDADDDPGAVKVMDVHNVYYTNVPKDAVLDINGTIIVEGGIYTSNGKASIISSEGTGKIQTVASGNKTVDVKYGTNTVKDDLPVTAAYLQNRDKITYVSTAAGGNFNYDVVSNAWRCENHTDEDNNHICEVCYLNPCSDCTDTDDHNCDICGKEDVTQCADGDDEDTLCDICGANLCDHDGEVTATPEAPANCVAEGNKAYWQCMTCGFYYSDVACTTEITNLEAWLADESEAGGKIKALGHAYGEVTYTWTDYTACVATRDCTVCPEGTEGHTETAEATITSEDTTPATCKAPGVRTHTATFNVDWAVEQTATEEIEVDNEAHAWDNACDTDCNNACGYTREITHSYGNWEETTAPGCETEGEKTKTCSECGDKQTQAVEATGHNMVAGDPVAATCKEAGYTPYTCSNGCGKTENRDIVSSTGCDYSTEWSTDESSHWHACSVCGEEAEKAAHADDNNNHKCDTCEYVMSECSFTVKGELQAAGTCMAEAVYEAKCSVCGAVSETKTITGEKDSTNHTGVNHTEKAEDATCTEAGYTGDTVCECGTTVKTGETISAKTHDYGETSYAWADDGKSCTAKRTCANDTSHVEEVTATIASKITTPATCTVMGTTTYTATFGVDWATEQTATRQDVAVIDHTYDRQNTEDTFKKSDATCTDAALYYYSCACGAKGSETFNYGEANGHSYANAVVDFSEDGTTYTVTVTCSVCTEAKTSESLNSIVSDTTAGDCQTNNTTTYSASGEYDGVNYSGTKTVEGEKGDHSYDDGVVTPPTCENGGFTTYTCQVEGCGHSYTDNETAASGHTYGTPIFSWNGYICTAKVVCHCNAEQSVDVEVTSKVTTTATCTVEGVRTYTATAVYNGTTYISDERPTENLGIDSTNHVNKTEHGQTAATCTEIGYTAGTYCNDCETWISGHAEIPAKDHSWTVSYSWTDDGKSCTATRACGNDAAHNETETVTAADAVKTAATCLEKGTTTYTANFVADWAETQTKDVQDIPTVDHTPGEAVVVENEKAATCTAEGSYDNVVYCTDCKAELSRNTVTVEKIAHTPAAAVEEKRTESTCTVAGSYDEVVYCSVCKTELSRATKPLELAAHTEGAVVVENEVAATCTAEGSYDNVVYCAVCDAELSRNTVTVEKIAHTPAAAVEENRVESTCTVAGSYESVVYCSACGKEISRETKALELAAHTEGAVVVENEKAATCTAEGSYDNVVYCTVCSAELSRNTVTVEKIAHTPAAAVEENRVESTCIAAGSYDEVVYCSVCKTELSRETVTVEKAAHTPATAVEENRVESTCTVAGSYDSVVYCSICGGEISRETKALELTAHTEGAVVVENEVAATCTAEGSYDNVVYCSVCNAELSRNTVTVDKLAHTSAAAVEENRVESTCTVAGSYDSVVYCSACGEELSRETKTLELAAHTEGTVVVENEVAATCTAEGSYDNVVYCSVCNAELSRSTVTVEKVAHNYDAVVTAPTCTAKGYTTYTCSACGDSYVADETEMVAHTPAAAVKENEKAPTCTATGSYDNVVYCSICNTELSRDTVTVEKIAHAPATAVEENRVESTCTVAGSYDSVVYCSVCDEEISRETKTLELAAHTEGTVVVENEVAATCTAEGSYDNVVYCSVCNAELSRNTVTVEKIAHTPAAAVEENRVESTCTVAGSYDSVVYCSSCNTELSREKKALELAAHDYESIVTAPTCTEDGYTTHTCTVCGFTSTTNGPDATDHKNTELKDKVDATCGKAGYTGDTYCNDCETTIANGEVIPATGEHTYDNACDAECNVCSAIRTPADHVYDNACDTNCNVCDAERSITHAWNNATCTAPKTCSVCGATEGEATGHVNTTSSTVQNDDGSTHTTTVTCACGEVVSTTTGTCTDAGSGSCKCGRMMRAEVNVVNKTKANDNDLYSISGTTLNVKHDLACVVLVEETSGTYRHISAMANVTAGGYDFDVSEVESGETVVIALKGDINCDGELDMMDQLCMDYLTANKSHPSYMTLDDVIGYFAVDLNAEGLMLVADLCRDGELDMMDQLYIDYATANASLYIALEWNIADN